MRSATLLVGTFLIGAMAVTVLTGLDRPREVSLPQHVAAVVVGCFMVLLWLVAVATVVWFPGVATALYLLAAALGLVGARITDVDELVVWAGASVVLAISSYLGHRGKRADDRWARAKAAKRARRLRWAEYQAAAELEGGVEWSRTWPAARTDLASATSPAPPTPPV